MRSSVVPWGWLLTLLLLLMLLLLAAGGAPARVWFLFVAGPPLTQPLGFGLGLGLAWPLTTRPAVVDMVAFPAAPVGHRGWRSAFGIHGF